MAPRAPRPSAARARGPRVASKPAHTLLPAEQLDARQLSHLPRAAWEAELAWDGARVTVRKFNARSARLEGPNRRDLGDTFPPLRAAVLALPAAQLLAEGFLCVLDEGGKPSFARLLAWARGERAGRLTLVLWDLLQREGASLAALPLRERRAQLDALVVPGGALLVSQPLEGPLPQLLESVRAAGLPGLLLREAAALPAVPARCVPPEAALVMGERALSAPPPVTNATKVLFPRDGLTKADLVAYYRAHAQLVVAHLRGRPVVAQRWPDGIDGFTWYQHRAPPRAPDYVRTTPVDDDLRLLVDSPDCLLWLVNQAALTFSTWTTAVGALQSPTFALFDLDPAPQQPFSVVVEVAQALGKLLELLEVPSVVKTSGQRGLHVLVPLAPGHDFAQVHAFARKVAQVMASLLPQVVSLEMPTAKRKGLLLFDHAQNFRGKTLVAPYSARGVDGAPVSTPLAWHEVVDGLDPRAFTVRTLAARLSRVGDLAAPLLAPSATVLEHALRKLP